LQVTCIALTNLLLFYYSSKKREARKKKKEAAHAASENHNNNKEEKEMPSACNISIKDIQMAMEVFNIQQKPAKTQEEAMQKSYQFWSTQPVPKMGELLNHIKIYLFYIIFSKFMLLIPDEKIVRNEPIEPDKTSVRAEPYSLPADFQWDTLNLDDPLVLSELYTLLSENYVEDDDAMFRFDYPPNFLKWALQPPGWCKEWHCGVRVSKSGRLVGFISAIPATLRVYNQ